MRPTVFLGASDDDKRWSARDRELAKALLLHEQSICDGCGQNLHESLDPDREGWYDVEVITCAGCKAKDDHLKDAEPKPGERLRITADPNYIKRS